MKTKLTKSTILNYKLMIEDERLGGKHNLIQDSDRNDSINLRIQGFSFCDFENDHRCSRDEFSQFGRRNLAFNHSVDVKMCLKVIGSKIFKDGGI